ncbi:MAG: hypothetical protein R3250_03015 [Melioribacteraceae bacterium]|nr:hypothetical protein [Melioribacteraceae bacterium]
MKIDEILVDNDKVTIHYNHYLLEYFSLDELRILALSYALKWAMTHQRAGMMNYICIKPTGKNTKPEFKDGFIKLTLDFAFTQGVSDSIDVNYFKTNLIIDELNNR